jgi:hypothetical protein
MEVFGMATLEYIVSREEKKSITTVTTPQRVGGTGARRCPGKTCRLHFPVRHQISGSGTSRLQHRDIHHRAGSVNHGMTVRAKWELVVDGIQPVAITNGMQRLYIMDMDKVSTQLPVDIFETAPASPAAVTIMQQAFPSGRRVTLIGINQYLFLGLLGVTF